MSSFANVIAASFKTLQAAAGAVVTFKRGATTVPGVTAVPGRSTLENDEPTDRTNHQVVSHDWIVTAADLGALNPPRKGDLVIREFGGKRITYEVPTPPWRPCDTDTTRIRVHSLRVKVEDL